MARSFLSALAGQVACICAVILFSGALFAGNPLLLAFFIVLYSAPVILVVWLLLLWPLYVLVPRSSVLWRPYVCVPCGLAAGGLLLKSWLALAFGDGQFWNCTYWSVGPLVGGVTCAVGCALKAAEQASAEPPRTSTALVYPHATQWWQRLACWLRDCFAEWSGQ